MLPTRGAAMGFISTHEATQRYIRTPAPKPAGLSPGSPSFSILFLKINELEKYLLVARSTEMWLRMHRVPPISPSEKKQRNTFTGSQPLNGASPSVESRRGEAILVLNVNLCCGTVTAMSHADKVWSH